MSELEDKIIKAFDDYREYPEAYKVWIEDVKSAFAEDASMSIKLPGMMSGQEWLSRFEKELLDIEKWAYSQETSACKTSDVREAAKRASGIEEPKQ